MVPVALTVNSELPPIPTVKAPVTAALPDTLTEPVNWCVSSIELPNTCEPDANDCVKCITEDDMISC